jgi:hypothetical protein
MLDQLFNNTPQKKMIKTPDTDLKWTKAVNGEDYQSVSDLVTRRPIIAWFRRGCAKDVLLLVKLDDGLFPTAQKKNEWCISRSDGRMCFFGKCKLQRALDRMLSFSTEWKTCEFETEIQYHQAVLEYLAE